MQFMSLSLDRLVKKMTDEDFKYLAEDFGSKKLGILKQKGAYPYDYMRCLSLSQSLFEKRCIVIS